MSPSASRLGTLISVWIFAPELGEHTEPVLNGLGIDWDEIAAMKQSGAIL